MLSQVVELIENQNNFAITTHVRPDGDGIGSSLGLKWLLTSLGKDAEVIVRDQIPNSYMSLPGAAEIRRVTHIDREYDAVFVMECSDIDRPGIADLDKSLVVNIDHHATCEHFGTINWIDPTASAVGEMIYNLCKAIGGRVSEEIAECVYMALVTDTGSFHFPNTSERTLKVASELVKAGANPSEVSEAVYNSYSWSRIALMQKVLTTLKRSDDGRIAFMRQTREMVRETGAVDGDNNGFVNIPLTARDVAVSFYMREVEDNVFRVSLRSKGEINVASVAEMFDGGGHKNAAGCRMAGEWDELENKLVDALTAEIEATDNEREPVNSPQLSLA